MEVKLIRVIRKGTKNSRWACLDQESSTLKSILFDNSRADLQVGAIVEVSESDTQPVVERTRSTNTSTSGANATPERELSPANLEECLNCRL